MNNEPVAIRYDFDGYGYQYMDSGSGSNWQTRVEGEPLYSEAFVSQQQAEIEALKEKLIMEEESYILLDEECLFAKEAIKLHQAEIAMLKQIIDANNLQSNIGQFIRPIDEPVAWISVLGIDHIGQKFTDVRVSLTKTDVADIPLYTHPAKELDEQFKEGFKAGKEEGWKAHKFHHPAKTLTDEEIESAWFKVFKPESGIGKNITNGVYEFARLIKESEK